MSRRGFTQQPQGTMQDAADTLGKATEKVVNQAAEAGQKAVDQAYKRAEDGVEKAMGQAVNAVSDLEKKLGLKK